MRDQRQADHDRHGRALDERGVDSVHRRVSLQHRLQWFQFDRRGAHVVELILAPAKDATQPTMRNHAANAMARLTSCGRGTIPVRSSNDEYRLLRQPGGIRR